MSTPKVFIIDDEQDNVDFVSAILAESPIETSGFTNGHIALEAMREDRPSLVILDVQMPVVNGFQVLKAMGDDDSLKAIPVVFLSAIGAVTGEDFSPDLIEQKYGVRPHAFIPKPIAHDKVLQTVQSILKEV